MENLNNYIKLNEIAEWVHANGKRVAIILEGRDGAGKSGTVRELTRFLPPYTFRVQPSFMPSKKMMRNWFSEWQKLLPNHGEIVIYDRSWYSRALLQPVMGWCSHKQYLNFIDRVNAWEDSQLDLHIVKLWLSIDEIKQRELLQRRENDPLRYWKHSPNDAKAVENFDALTLKKNIMFSLDDWLIVDMDDKQRGRDTILDNIVKTL
jgi:polyphosphate kinase 2 (PPK2 family)